MAVPPESIGVGKCYLVRAVRSDRAGGIWRVVRIIPDGRIQYERRTSTGSAFGWRPGIKGLPEFVAMLEREVPCDWTPTKGES